MNIILCSDNIQHISYWEKSLQNTNTYSVEYKELLCISESIIIIYEGGCDCAELETICQRNRVLLLSEILHTNKFQFYFRQGVLGYGNIYMQDIFLHSAIATLKNNDVWIAPKLNRELMQEVKKSQQENLTNKLRKYLSTKELLIAELLHEGYTNRQIAQKRDISINTLKSHIKNIYTKLGIKNRFELLKYYNHDTHP